MRPFDVKWLARSAGLLLAAVPSPPLLAQCAMCKTSVAAASNTDHISRILNVGILALLIPALIFFLAIFAVISRWREEDAALSQKATRTDHAGSPLNPWDATPHLRF
jgi:uncharacterized membrane-anchored protein